VLLANDSDENKTEFDHQQAATQDQAANAGLLPKLVVELLQLGGFFYVLGFIVIMVHTTRLRVPVVEALHFQNLIAGLPLGLLMFPALRAWRPLTREIVKRGSHAVALSWILVTAMLLLIPVGLRQVVHFFPSLSLSAMVAVGFTLPIAFSIYCLVASYQENFPLGQATATAMAVYTIFIVAAIGYAWFIYPSMPQSIGGGRPERVRLYVKPGELGSLLGQTGPSTGSPGESFRLTSITVAAVTC
jgi:hypothetical protein